MIIRYFEKTERVFDTISYGSMTVTEVGGSGQYRGLIQEYVCDEYVVGFLPNMEMEIVIPQDVTEELTRTIKIAEYICNVVDSKILSTAERNVLQVR
jgi:nitrogen regulatory protein PII